MDNKQKVNLIEATLIIGLSLVAKAFGPNEEQQERLDTLLDLLDAKELSEITEDFEDVLSLVEEFVNNRKLDNQKENNDA